MGYDGMKVLKRGAWAALLPLFAATTISAQTRVTLPAGSVILVRTQQALESGNARVGQTFETTVVDPVSVNGYTVIPANSRIRGVVAYVQPADRQRSGVMQIGFDRLVLPGGGAYTIAGQLTSMDSTERRQIEARADSRVVLVGERGGIGAAIAGAGSNRSPAGSILGALAGMLSEGQNVSVPAGTTLAVQLARAVTLTGRGAFDAGNQSTIYTQAERIRAAQRALAQRAYLRTTATGALDNPTRKALFEFQIDNNIPATGNLDGRTAAALGILGANAGADGAGMSGVLSVREAGILRRAAQALAARHRQELGIGAQGQVTGRRGLAETDMELMFALSAFADNASVYEQLVRGGGRSEGAALSRGALTTAARRVDASMQRTRTSAQTQNVWQSIRQQLAQLDPSYR